MPSPGKATENGGNAEAFPYGESFVVMLNWLMGYGVSPKGTPAARGRRWTNAAFARDTGATDRSVRNWRSGNSIPAYFASIERVLFADNSTYDPWRVELWNAYARALDAQGTAKVGHRDELVPRSPAPSTPTLRFTDGDWITAAIVAPERAKTILKGAAARLNRLSPPKRTIESVEGYIEAKIGEIGKRQSVPDASDEFRSEACISGVVVDILGRELGNFLWNAGERPDDDPISVFRETVKAFLIADSKTNASRPKSEPKVTHQSKAGELGPVTGRVSPKQRDAIRAERNRKLVAALETCPGIEHTWVMQLEDHSDKGYLISVDFDPRQQSASDVLTLVRGILDEMTPHVPFWGQMMTEAEESVSFGFTYIDEYNKAVGRRA